MLMADDYGEMTAARLFDFFNRHSPWHQALWGIGTALSLEEVVEYSELTRAGAFPSKDGLRYVADSARAIVARDEGVSPTELREAVLDALDDRAIESDPGAATLRHLADRVRDGYLRRLAAAARGANPPGVESLSSAAGSHLLDLGFSPGFLHGWLRTLVKERPEELHIADVLEEGAALCVAPIREFEVVIPCVGLPGYPGPMPVDWLGAQGTKDWLGECDPPIEGDVRQAGSVRVLVPARDPWSAVEAAAELFAQAAARVTIGSRNGHLRTKGIGWVRGEAQDFPLSPRTRVRLLSLKTAQHVFDVSTDPADAVVYDALEIFSALESGTRGAAVTGGWAAVEGLLLRPGESPHVRAADRLAAIIACAFPRAELTTLSHRHRPVAPDALAAELDGVEANVVRCRIVEESIRAGALPVVLRPSDRALLRRVEGMVADPGIRLANVRRYVSDTLRRLYTHRNLIMHAGSFQSVTLRATLRTAPKLVAAGVDRVVDARLGARKLDPLALAARAEAELSLLAGPAARPISNLLD